MNPSNCEFVMVGGYWLPGVAGESQAPVYIGDYDSAYSGVLRVAHVGIRRKWRVLLAGVPSEEVPMLEEVLRSPVPVGCNVMGEEVIASVKLVSSVRRPVMRGPNTDWNRRNYEIDIEETWAEHVLPGYTYQYAAFMDTGSFVWDWEEAGFPNEVDVLIVGGGGGGGLGQGWTRQGTIPESYAIPGGGAGGGAGGVRLVTGIPVSGDVSGTVGAGGAGGNNGQNSSFAGETALGGGFGKQTFGGPAGSGGSGGGGNPGGSGTPGQGHDGGHWWSQVSGSGQGGYLTLYYPPGGGGASTPGPDRRVGGSAVGGTGIDLLSIGWNYRQTPGVNRYLAGGGSGASWSGSGPVGGVGGGGSGGASNTPAGAGQPNTGGGGGGGAARGAIEPKPQPPDEPGGTGGSGLVIVRWLVD